MSSLNRTIFKQSVIVSVLGLVAQVLGFASTVLIAKQFGASWQTDSWFFSYAIAMVVVNTVAGIAKLVFVPIFVEERVQAPERVQATVGMIVTSMLAISAVSLPCIWFLADMGLMNVGSTEKMQDLVVQLVTEMLPCIPFAILSTIFMMIYQAYQKFGWAELAMALRPLMVILTLLFKPDWGIHCLAIGNNIGYLFSTIAMAIILYTGTGLNVWPKWGFSPVVKKMAVMAAFPLLSILPSQIEPVALRAICAKMAEGSISALNYADRLAVIPMLLIGKGFMGVILSHWSKCSAENALDEVGRSLNRALSMLFTIVCPIVAGLIVTRSHLVRFAFRRGEFTEQDVALTIGVFMFLSISIIPEYLKMLLTRVLVICRDMKTMFVLTMIYTVTELGLALGLGIHWQMGVYGVGAAILSARVIMFVLCLLALKRYNVQVLWLTHAINSLKVIIACGIMSIGAKLIQWHGHELFLSAARGIRDHVNIRWVTEMAMILEIGSMALAGGIIYIGLLMLMRHADAKSLLSFVRLK